MQVTGAVSSTRTRGVFTRISMLPPGRLLDFFVRQPKTKQTEIARYQMRFHSSAMTFNSTCLKFHLWKRMNAMSLTKNSSQWGDLTRQRSRPRSLHAVVLTVCLSITSQAQTNPSLKNSCAWHMYTQLSTFPFSVRGLKSARANRQAPPVSYHLSFCVLQLCKNPVSTIAFQC